MLSERKYGALFNNFTEDDVATELKAQGCRDFDTNTEAEGRCTYSMQGKSQDAENGTNISESWTDLLTISAAQPQNAAAEEGSTGGPDHQQVSSLPFSSNIRCLVFPRGDITRFKPARWVHLSASLACGLPSVCSSAKPSLNAPQGQTKMVCWVTTWWMLRLCCLVWLWMSRKVTMCWTCVLLREGKLWLCFSPMLSVRVLVFC